MCTSPRFLLNGSHRRFFGPQDKTRAAIEITLSVPLIGLLVPAMPG